LKIFSFRGRQFRCAPVVTGHWRATARRDATEIGGERQSRLGLRLAARDTNAVFLQSSPVHE
jgi:hypothetical protein